MLMIHVACADTGKNDESMEDADTKDHAPSETVLNSWSKYVEVHGNAEYAWNNTDDSKIP